MSWTLLSLPPVPLDTVQRRLEDVEIEVLPLIERRQELVDVLLPRADIVLADWSSDLRVTVSGPRLTLVQMPGSGANGVDVDAMTRAGVTVANCHGVNAVSVAEWSVSATLALLRRTVAADVAVRAGRWPQSALGGRELSGRSVGIVGMGAFARHASKLFAAFGCDVRYWSRTKHQDAPASYLPLDAVVGESDVVVVAVPLAAETIGLVDPRAMAHGSILISGGQGAVVDQEGLLEALISGRLAAAALDVFPAEPLPGDAPIRAVPNLLLSPHIGGVTEESIKRLLDESLENIRRAVTGDPVADVINGFSQYVKLR